MAHESDRQKLELRVAAALRGQAERRRRTGAARGAHAPRYEAAQRRERRRRRDLAADEAAAVEGRQRASVGPRKGREVEVGEDYGGGAGASEPNGEPAKGAQTSERVIERLSDARLDHVDQELGDAVREGRERRVERRLRKRGEARHHRRGLAVVRVGHVRDGVGVVLSSDRKGAV